MGVWERGPRVGAVYSRVPSPSCWRAMKLVALTVNEPKPPDLPSVPRYRYNCTVNFSSNLLHVVGSYTVHTVLPAPRRSHFRYLGEPARPIRHSQ